METIIGCIITAIASIVTVAITNVSSNRKAQFNSEKNQAVTDTKLEELTEEVRKHNNFATRIPVLEEKVNNIDERLKKVEK